MRQENQKRLDRVLVEKYPQFSRAFFQKFIRQFGVSVKGKLVKKLHFSVSENDAISLDESQLARFTKERESKTSLPYPLLLRSASRQGGTAYAEPSRILFNGKGFFVVDKPPNVRTEDIAHGFFPVHRLDKDTSGVLVIAKNQQMQAALQKQWQEKTVKKTYLALVKGRLSPAKGAIEAGIARSQRDRMKMTVSSSIKARAAYTEYKVLKYFPSTTSLHSIGATSLLSLFPKTGRTHQIRVHLSSIGHPVIGDSLYGDEKLNKKIEQEYGLRRQFLHAHKLSLLHPGTGKRVTYTSKLPEDLDKALRKFMV